MERPMRRKELATTPEKAAEILQNSEFGTLSTVSASGEPHAVPISFVLKDGAICFHCAQDGLKMENMRARPGVCFSAVSHSEVFYSNHSYTTLYESAIVYGKAVEVTAAEEKTEILRALCERYAPESMEHFESSLGALPRTAVVKIIPDRITGKSNLHRRNG